MKKTLRIAMVGMAAFFLLIGSASAITYTFYDNTINWPGWTPQYTQDRYGHPDVFNPPNVALSVVVGDNNNLETIIINMEDRDEIVNQYLGPDPALTWDALFISSTGTGWDYYVEDINADNTGATLYSVSDGYVYKLATQPGPTWSGRWGHPAGIARGKVEDTSGLLASVIWDDAANTLTYSFNPGIVMGSSFQIGYSQWCANDVIITPEPGMMLLLGFGLVGIVALRRKFDK